MYQVRRLFYNMKHMPWVTHFLLSISPKVYEPRTTKEACEKFLDEVYQTYLKAIVIWHRGHTPLRSFTKALRKKDSLIIQSKKGHSFFEFKIFDNEKSNPKQRGCFER